MLQVTTGPKAALSNQWTKHLQYSTEVSTPKMRGEKKTTNEPQRNMQSTNHKTFRKDKIICRMYKRCKSQRRKTLALPILRRAAGTRSVGSLMLMEEEGKDSLARFCPNICKN